MGEGGGRGGGKVGGGAGGLPYNGGEGVAPGDPGVCGQMQRRF